MFGFLKNFISEERSTPVDDWLQGKPVDWGEKFADQEYVGEEQALTESTVMSCVRILSESEAVLPLQLKQKDPTTGKIKRVESHNASYLIEKEPNQVQNPFEFREMIVKNIALNGNFYGIYKKDKYGNPIEICPEYNNHLIPFAYNGKQSTYSRYFPGARVAYEYTSYPRTREITRIS